VVGAEYNTQQHAAHDVAEAHLLGEVVVSTFGILHLLLLLALVFLPLLLLPLFLKLVF